MKNFSKNLALSLLLLAALLVLVWIGIAWMPVSRLIAKGARAVWEGIPDKINTYRWNKAHGISSDRKPKKEKKKKSASAPQDVGMTSSEKTDQGETKE